MKPILEVESFFEKHIPGLFCAFLERDERVRDFVAGREAVGRALSKLGVKAEIPKAETGEPLWPRGVVGSISHSKRYAFSVVALKERFSSLGCDVEDPARFNHRIAERVVSEKDRWPTFMEERIAWALVFSAKEAFYKLQYPILRESLGFRDVRVIVGENGRLKVEGKITSSGLFYQGPDFVIVVLYPEVP